MNMNEELNEKIERLKSASILDVPNIIQEIELYDKKSASDIFEEISQEMDKGNLIDNVITPVLSTVVDGILSHPRFKGIASKSGLSATRVMRECESFNYENRASYLLPDALVETRNQEASSANWGTEHRAEFIREKYHNPYEMNKYKKKNVTENDRNKNLKDAYRGRQDITPDKNNPDGRRNDPKHEHNAETDHIIPLKTVFEQLQNNMGLSDDDLRKIANQDYNFALTARMVNNPKRAMSNTEFIALQDKNKSEGKPYVELSPEARENMIRLEKQAQKEINNQVNSTVIENIIGEGEPDRNSKKTTIETKEKELGRKLTNEERDQINKDLAAQKARGIHKENIKQAGKQTLGYALGSALLFVIKPLYYEIKDGVIYGFKEGVMATTYKEAFKIRFQRVKKYVWEQLSSLKDIFVSCMEALTNFINALIEGIIGMFVGIFKNILKITKEGIKVFVESWPILFGKDSKKMSVAQKGDAIIKILGGTVVAILGTFLDQLLTSHASVIPEDFKIVVSTMLTGIASALLFYTLDKADLFNVKKEQREARLNEIFAERSKDIEKACNDVHSAVIDKVRDTYTNTRLLLCDFKSAWESSDYRNTNLSLLQIAKTLGVSLEYSNEKEFESLKNNNQLNWNT